jgi:hypothetical protein
VPTPTDDLQVGELIGRLDHDEGRVGNQVMCLQETADPSRRQLAAHASILIW